MPQDSVKRFSLARAVKREAYAAYLAARDPRVPWDAKALACRSLAMMCASHFEGGPSHEPEQAEATVVLLHGRDLSRPGEA